MATQRCSHSRALISFDEHGEVCCMACMSKEIKPVETPTFVQAPLCDCGCGQVASMIHSQTLLCKADNTRATKNFRSRDCIRDWLNRNTEWSALLPN